MEKTSLEKSHSKASNFKLTLICLLASFGTSGLFLTLAFLLSLETLNIPLLIACIACGLVSVLCVSLFSKFTR